MTHSPMRWLSALPLALCAASCRTNPAIPFQDDHWQFFVLGGTGAVKDDYVEHRDHLALEVVVPREGTSGWAYEVALRFAQGEGAGLREMGSSQGGGFQRSERELDFREIAIGTRQVYRQGSIFEPYYGVGLSYVLTESDESFIDTNGVPHGDGDHYHDYGIYMRTGIHWNTLRGVLAEDTEVKIGLDVRGLYATDYSALEFALALGIGR